VSTESLGRLTHQKHSESTSLFKKGRNKKSYRDTAGDYAQMGEPCQSEVSSNKSQNSKKPGDQLFKTMNIASFITNSNRNGGSKTANA
jgi:hypothetical protein